MIILPQDIFRQRPSVRQGKQIQEIYRKSTVNQLIYFFEHNIIHNTVQLMICMYLRPIILAVNKIINSLDSLFSYDNLCVMTMMLSLVKSLS